MGANCLLPRIWLGHCPPTVPTAATVVAVEGNQFSAAYNRMSGRQFKAHPSLITVASAYRKGVNARALIYHGSRRALCAVGKLRPLDLSRS
jgi:hypothetical protein